ncbi:hypothetical protein D7V91_05910 [bacterium 1xD42-67]|nr:hypothetical protein D7V91_05910 [bacterium 1xD42-67]
MCLIALSCGDLVSCQMKGAETLPSASWADLALREPAAPQPAEADSRARERYGETIHRMLWENILPDGTQIPEGSLSGYMFENTFAVADVDGDGREELVICFTTAPTAGRRGWVLDYDEPSDSVRIQYEGGPSLTFYTNGAMAENDSHAQGSWTSDFWPYTLYSYQPETDSYAPAGHVDAWEEKVSDEDPEDLPPFPVEKDESVANILYYITPGEDLGDDFIGYSREAVDQSVYQAWLEPILGDAQPLALRFRTLPAAADYLNSREIPADGSRPGLLRTPDWNGNGILEHFILLEEADGDLTLEIWEDGQVLAQKVGERSYPSSLFLCALDGVDYLLDYSVYEEQGICRLDYSLSTWAGEFTEDARWDSISFDLNFGSPHHGEFDPAAIAAFVDELNGLLGHSELLFTTDPGFPAEGREDLSRLEGFARNSGKSLEEDLRALAAAAPADWTPPAAVPGTGLPIDGPIELTFFSGAGAWRIELTLAPDGSFTGDYCDADMDVHYVCQFHGRFKDIAQVSDASWYMILEELVLDTGRPVGEEWDEGGIHYISSDPYGFDDVDGPLPPGAAFLFYAPGAQGHAPGTELYGAGDFWTWQPIGSRNPLHVASQTLGRYGLHSLETGYGFFTWDR